MKKNLLIPGALLFVSTLALNSCGEDVAGGSDRKGSILPMVSIDSGFLGIDIESRAGSDDPGVEDLALTVTSTDGSYSKSWESVTDFDPQEEFPIGTYTVEVSCGDPEDEGFGKKAAYYDSQDIKVFENESTPVSLKAVRTHAMLTLKYTEAFEHYVKTAAIRIVSPSNSSIIFQYNDEDPETRSALLVPGLTKVSMSMQRYNGTWVDVNVMSFETKAQYHYTVTLDVNQGNLGNPMLQVEIDDNVDEEVVEVDLSDEVVNAPAPEIFLEGIDAEETITIVEGSYAGEPIRASIIAKGDIASVNLNVKSTYLEQANWKAATETDGVDLIPMSKEEQTIYSRAGLECHGIWNQPGRMAVIDFTKVVNGLEFRESDKTRYGNVSSFTLNVTDRNGNTPEAGPLSFSVKILPVELSLQNPSYLKIGDTEMDVELAFNGGDPADKVIFKVKDFNGLVPVKAAYTKKGDNLYTVHLSEMPTYYSPSNGNKTTIQAEFEKNDGTVKDYALDVERHGVIASTTSNNVFAKYVYVTLTPVNLAQSEIDNPAFILVSDNNKALTASKYSENIYKVEGLTPGTENTVTAKFGNPDIYCVPVSFTTETEAQLANRTFDADFTQNGSGSYWENMIVPGGWGTNNAMTTSQGSNYAYCRISGTIQTTDGHNGKAALIRTVGWGSGNTASGSVTTGKMKYADAGLLHIGSTRSSRPSGYSDVQGALTTDDLDCGVTFNSRPSALSFWYKYSPKNSADKGEAEVWVKDANGNTLASGVIALSATTNYTKVSMPLTYNYNAVKATKIYVKFLSTNDRKFLEKDSSNFTPPPFGNLAYGTYMGSQLYIDDIELVY